MSKIEITDEMVERFQNKVYPEPNSGCWLWTGSVGKNRRGVEYGKFNARPEQQAHRVAHIIWKGEIPEGQIVRHKCDNSYCVNPDHLECGNASDNVQDSLKRGRHVAPTGERHGRAKRTLAQVIEARRAYRAGETPKEIGARLGIPTKSLHRVWDGWPDADAIEPKVIPRHRRSTDT